MAAFLSLHVAANNQSVPLSVQSGAGLPLAGVPHTELALGGRVLLEADVGGAQNRGGDEAESAALEAAPDEGETEAGTAQERPLRRRRIHAGRDRRGARPLRYEETARRHGTRGQRRPRRPSGLGIGQAEEGNRRPR